MSILNGQTLLAGAMSGLANTYSTLMSESSSGSGISMDDLSNLYGYKLLKGSSTNVDQLVKKIVKEKGINYLYNFAKVNFKNTQKGLK